MKIPSNLLTPHLFSYTLIFFVFTGVTSIVNADSKLAADGQKLNHIEAAKKYKQTANELDNLLTGELKANVKHRMLGFRNSAFLRGVDNAISNSNQKKMQRYHKDILYSLSQSERELVDRNNKMQEIKQKVERTADLKDANSERYRNQLGLTVSDLSYTLQVLAVYHETLNKLEIQTAQQSNQTSIAQSNSSDIKSNSQALNPNIVPCQNNDAKSEATSFISLAGASVGMTKSDLFQSTCAEANGNIMLVGKPSSISFMQAFRGQGIPQTAELTQRFDSSSKASVSASTKTIRSILYEPVEELHLCIDCKPDHTGRPKGGAYLANGLTIRFMQDGKAAAVQRNHQFKNSPETVANFLTPMTQKLGPPSYQSMERGLIRVGWVFPNGKQALPTENWYRGKAAAGKLGKIELNRDGLLDGATEGERRMHMIAQKPQASYCIAEYMRGVGPFTVQEGGQTKKFSYADDWQYWDTYLYERSQGKVSPKRPQPFIEKYAPPGYTNQCGVIVLANLYLEQKSASVEHRVNLQSNELLRNATVELLDTEQLKSKFEKINLAKAQLETHRIDIDGLPQPLSEEDARKAANMTTTLTEAEKRYDTQNATDSRAYKSCLYRDKVNADLNDRTRCQSLDPLGRPVTYWNQQSIK